ncbi:hypothetical protein HOC01_04265 [archaeon]|jgi:hypothetical protein|nr:hypothetical protein [archaeon]MBT6698374.1 hypothetical protein [archaeon]
MQTYHNKSQKEIFASLNSKSTGLSSKEATKRLNQFGKNNC